MCVMCALYVRYVCIICALCVRFMCIICALCVLREDQAEKEKKDKKEKGKKKVGDALCWALGVCMYVCMTDL